MVTSIDKYPTASLHSVAGDIVPFARLGHPSSNILHGHDGLVSDGARMGAPLIEMFTPTGACDVHFEAYPCCRSAFSRPIAASISANGSCSLHGAPRWP